MDEWCKVKMHLRNSHLREICYKYTCNLSDFSYTVHVCSKEGTRVTLRMQRNRENACVCGKLPIVIVIPKCLLLVSFSSLTWPLLC